MEEYGVYALLGVSTLLGLGLLNRHFNGGVNVHKPSQEGKLIVITGANAGLGYVAAEELAKSGARVILACRDEARGQAAVNKIKEKTLSQYVEYMNLDLDDLDSVAAFNKAFRAKGYKKIDTLMMNAGIMALPTRETSKQGFEKQFGVNHIGHFLLATLLFDKVKAAPEGRIIVTSSNAHKRWTKTINWDDMGWEKTYNGFQAYSMSKLSNVYFTRQLAKKLEEKGIDNVKVVSLHPGVVRTELGRYMMTGWKWFMMSPIIPLFFLCSKPVWYGAQTQLHCALCPFAELENGKYYSDCAVKAETLNDDWEEEAKKLWDYSENAVKKW